MSPCASSPPLPPSQALMASNVASFIRAQPHEEISRYLVTQPAACHTGGHFEQIRHDTFVQASNAFLGQYHRDSVPDRFVLVPYSGHGVDLEPPPEDVTVNDHVKWMDGRMDLGMHTMDKCMFEQRRPKWHQQLVSGGQMGSYPLRG